MEQLNKIPIFDEPAPSEEPMGEQGPKSAAHVLPWRSPLTFFGPVLVALLLLLAGVFLWTQPYPPSNGSVRQLEVKAEEIDAGIDLARPNEYVTLVFARGGDDGSTPELTRYADLKVLKVLHEGDARAGVVLSLLPEVYDDLVTALADEENKAVLVLPQGAFTATPTLEPTATAAATPIGTPATSHPAAVLFDLPATAIRSDLGGLEKNAKNLVLILVDQREGSVGQIISSEGHRYEDVTLVEILDADGHPVDKPYEDASVVRISLRLDATDGDAADFASHLDCAAAIYFVLP